MLIPRCSSAQVRIVGSGITRNVDVFQVADRAVAWRQRRRDGKGERGGVSQEGAEEVAEHTSLAPHQQSTGHDDARYDDRSRGRGGRKE